MTTQLVSRLSWILVAVAIVLRAWVQVSGGFRQQDFVALDLGRAALADPAILLTGANGVTSPLLLIANMALTGLAPLAYLPAAAAMVLLWATVAIVARTALIDVFGPRPLVLVPLALALVATMTLPATSWWSTAPVALPALVGVWLALWAVCRTPRHPARDAALLIGGTALVLFAAGPVGWTPWALVPLVALGLAASLDERPGFGRALLTVLRRQSARWVVTGLLFIAWITWSWAAGAGQTERPLDWGPYASFVGRGVLDGVAAGVAGGPLAWFGGGVGLPVAAPPTWMVVVGAQVLLVLAAGGALLRPGAGRAWGVVGVGGVAMLAVAAVEARVVFPEAAGTLVAMAPLAAPLSMVVALTIMSRHPHPEPPRLVWVRSRTRRLQPFLVAALVLDLALIAATLSTVAWRDAWRSPEASSWLKTAEESLAAADPAVPLLPQAVPEQVVSPLLAPVNLTSVVLGTVAERPPFADVTSRLVAFDAEGRLRATTLEGIRPDTPPPFPCGWPAVDGVATIDMGRDLPNFTYVVRVRATTTGEGVMDLRLGTGAPVSVPFGTPSSASFVRLTGEGRLLVAEIQTPEVGVCLSSIVVGQVAELEIDEVAEPDSDQVAEPEIEEQ